MASGLPEPPSFTGVARACGPCHGHCRGTVLLASARGPPRTSLRAKWLNESLVFPGLLVTIPFGRFRDTHLAHHHDPILTDPYDDPESNYFDPAVWARTARVARLILSLNNTLLGRIFLGPLIGNLLFLRGEARLMLGAIRRFSVTGCCTSAGSRFFFCGSSRRDAGLGLSRRCLSWPVAV